MIQSKEMFKEKIVKKIEELPEQELKEVLDFVDSLEHKKYDNEDPILKVSGCLSGSGLSAEEIEEELYGEDKKEVED